ncbi:YadA-like family protein [Luteimonas saliphila]|uniref:YadA-like family protein n=1 Tax=Luteimonas saliphila TaxID=2804919 RepID=UPI00192E24A0|nr:YadA-like family protein [Luteimonas saliphila]
MTRCCNPVSNRLRRSVALALLSLAGGHAAAGDTCVTTPVQAGADAAYAGDWQSTLACGRQSFVTGAFSVGYGAHTTSVYDGAALFGYNADAFTRNSTAIGNGAIAGFNGPGELSNRTGSTAVGAYTNAARGAVAIGLWYDVDRDGSLDENERTIATNEGAVAIGAATRADGINAVAIGFRNTAASSGVGLGSLNAAATYGTAVGYDNTVAFGGSALGLSNRSGSYAAAFGGFNQAMGQYSLAMGYTSEATGASSVAIGANANATVDNSVAIGSGSVADREFTVSIGSPDRMYQIANLAAATADTDAVNLSQLFPVATALGGGASYAGGVFIAPGYDIRGTSYDNAGDAFFAIDAWLGDVEALIAEAGGVPGPQGPAGPQGPEGPAGGGPRSVMYDQDEGDTITLNGEDGTLVSNVADGIADMDAVNVRQMRAGDAMTLQSARAHADAGDAAALQAAQVHADAGDAATLASANTYTDTVAVQTLQSANEYTDSRFAAWDAQLDSIQRGIDDRFHQQDRRIDRQGAMSGAFAGMAMNTAGLSGRNRVGVGVGAQGGEQALAVGYQRAVGDRASVSLGGAFSGGEKSVMGGAGFSW